MDGNPLDQIPFYGAFVRRQLMNEQAPAREMQQLGQALNLQGQLQRHSQQQAFQRDVAGLGPEPTQEQLTGVASKYADPQDLLRIHQSSIDRKEAVKERALQFAQSLDVRQQQLDMQRQQMEQRNADAQSKLQFEQWYKSESLRNRQAAESLNTQLRLQGLEIQKHGRDLQIQRFDAERSAKEEKDIEQQVGKTADRMKDVMPVWTSAQQLNNILGQYTPQQAPGIGYLKNTDAGKMFLSEQGKDVSAKVKLFGNSVLKAMSGAAVTAPEEVRQMAAMMADGRFSADDFYRAWPTLSAWVNDQVSLSTAGLTPKARERFIERTGLKLDPITPRFTFEGGTLKDSRAAPTRAAVPPPPPGFVVQ